MAKAKRKVTKGKAAVKAKRAKDMKRKKAEAEATRKAKHTAALTALNPIAKEINVRLDKATQSEVKADDHRLAAALRLAEAHAMCVAQKIRFKSWCEENVMQSYETVRKLTTIGASSDPALALADLRAGNKAANKALRSRSKASAKLGEAVAAKTPFQNAEHAMAALDDKPALNLIESIASKSGMRVISETDHKKLKNLSKTPLADGLLAAKSMFDMLKASEKMALVEYGAAKVGVVLQKPDYDADPERPKNLDRNKGKKIKRGVAA